MGAVTSDESKEIAELSALSMQAKMWLMHHLGNPLNVITLAAHLDRKDDIKKSVDHIMSDMQKIGCFEMWKS